MAKDNVVVEQEVVEQEFAEVFAANPDATEIFVVGEMPFLTKDSADGYATSENRLLIAMGKAANAVVKVIQKLTIAMLLLALVCNVAFAQNTEGVEPQTGIWAWILDNKMGFSTTIIFLLSLASRFFPTRYSLDILKWVTFLLDNLLGDKKASGGNFKTQVKD